MRNHEEFASEAGTYVVITAFLEGICHNLNEQYYTEVTQQIHSKLDISK